MVFRIALSYKYFSSISIRLIECPLIGTNTPGLSWFESNSKHPSFPELELNHQIQFCAILWTHLFVGEG